MISPSLVQKVARMGLEALTPEEKKIIMNTSVSDYQNAGHGLASGTIDAQDNARAATGNLLQKTGGSAMGMMSISDFAQKIKQKYPQYNSLSDQDLTNKMLAKYPQYKSQIQESPEDKLTGVAKSITNISQNIGGVAKDLGLGGAVDLISNFGAGKAVQNATGINPLLNSQTLQQEKQQPLQNAAGDVGGAALDLGGGELLGMAGKAIGKVAPYAKYALTHPTMGKAVAGQAKQVVGDELHDLTPFVQKSLKAASSGEHEFNSNVAKEVQNIWDTKLAAPKTIEEATFRNNGAGIQVPTKQKVMQLTKQQLLNLRKAVGKQADFGTNKYSDGNAANKIVYRTINDMLKGEKGIAPGLKVPDKVIGMYSKTGSLGHIAGKAAAGTAVDQTIGKHLPPEIRTLLDFLVAGKV